MYKKILIIVSVLEGGKKTEHQEKSTIQEAMYIPKAEALGKICMKQRVYYSSAGK